MATRKCSERGRLLNLYSHATEQLSRLVVTLTDVAAGTDSTAFNRAWERYQRASGACSQIKRQPYEHMAEHGCGPETTETLQ
jgi:hypothetical protein